MATKRGRITLTLKPALIGSVGAFERVAPAKSSPKPLALPELIDALKTLGEVASEEGARVGLARIFESYNKAADGIRGGTLTLDAAKRLIREAA